MKIKKLFYIFVQKNLKLIHIINLIIIYDQIYYCWYNIRVLFSTRFNSIACDLRLNEHTAQMYVPIDIACFGRYVIYKDYI